MSELSAAELIASLSMAPRVETPAEGWLNHILARGESARRRWSMPKEQHYLLILCYIGHRTAERTLEGEAPVAIELAEISKFVGFGEATTRSYCRTLVRAGCLYEQRENAWSCPIP